MKKIDFEMIQNTDRLEKDATIRGHSVVIAKNYVLFSSDPAKSRVLSRPPVVAWHPRGKPAEEWSNDKFSQTVKRMTLGVAEGTSGRKRSLRIRNSQRAHRHIVFEVSHLEAESWRAEFLQLIGSR
jgi:hypothetical protein